MAGLGGFAAGLARSPLGNLPGLIMAREKMSIARKQNELSEKEFGLREAEHKLRMGEAERVQQTRGAVTDAYKTGGLPAAGEAALGAGDVAQAGALHNLEVGREDFAYGKANRSQQDWGRMMAAGWRGGDEDIGGNLDFMNRLVKTNPEMFQKAIALEKHRVPIGFELTEGPDGEPMMGLTVYNKKTKSVGPATENASADGADNVVTVDPRRMMSIARMWAEGKNPKKGAAPKGFDLEGGVRLNKDTGAMTRVPASPAEQRKEIFDLATDLTNTRASLNFDHGARTRMSGTLAEIGQAAQRIGVDPTEAMNRAARYLASDNEISKAVIHGKGADAQDAGMLKLYQRLGLIPARNPGVSSGRGTGKKKPDSNGRSAAPKKADPRATMPKGPRGGRKDYLGKGNAFGGGLAPLGP